MNRLFVEGHMSREEFVAKTDGDYESFPRFSPRKQFNRLRWVDTPEYYIEVMLRMPPNPVHGVGAKTSSVPESAFAPLEHQGSSRVRRVHQYGGNKGGA